MNVITALDLFSAFFEQEKEKTTAIDSKTAIERFMTSPPFSTDDLPLIIHRNGGRKCPPFYFLI
jgi:hypothetical protein